MKHKKKAIYLIYVNTEIIYSLNNELTFAEM